VAPPRITLVVARARNGVIGRDNTLPWHLPEDLQHFRATTLGHPILMGRRTFDSIGRALPGRRTLVLTADPAWSRPGCERVGSLDDALRLTADAPELFVVGGARVYADALPRADRLLVTEVDLEVEGDTFFPAIDPARWRLVGQREGVGRSGLRYAIGTWERRRETA
jgi:dihydrofolate reductase